MTDPLIESPLETHWAEEQVGLKLDLGCGGNLRKDYVGVDSTPLDVLIKANPSWNGGLPPSYEGYVEMDLLEFPWPFPDNSVAATYSSHFVEHIPHQIPGSDPKVDGWWHFFAELYRVLEDGGIAEFVHPFSRSDRAFWDPTHTRFIHHQTWFYLDPRTRYDLQVDHYAPDVNFEVLNIQALHEPALLEGRSAEVIEFARQFYFNPTDDLFVVIKANK